MLLSFVVYSTNNVNGGVQDIHKLWWGGMMFEQMITTWREVLGAHLVEILIYVSIVGLFVPLWLMFTYTLFISFHESGAHRPCSIKLLFAWCCMSCCALSFGHWWRNNVVNRATKACWDAILYRAGWWLGVMGVAQVRLSWGAMVHSNNGSSWVVW